MSRRLTALLLAGTAAAVLGGCSSVVSGTATPQSGSAGSTPAAGGSCARSNEPQQCEEWVNTKPETGDQLFAVSAQDEVKAAQMLCSALPNETWDKFLGPGHYRYLEQGPACTLSSADDQLVVSIALWAKDPLSGYLTRFKANKSIAPTVSEFAIAGKPVMRVGDPSDADGKGREKEELTIAPSGDANKPGVLQARMSMRQPRGKSDSTPVDRARLDGIRDAVVAELLKVLFPQR